MGGLVTVLKFLLCAAVVIGILDVESNLISKLFESKPVACPTILTGIKNAESKN